MAGPRGEAGFRFPLDKYDDPIALYTNFRYLQEYLKNIWVFAYTDEKAQDAIGGILTDSSEIDFTYNDNTPSISATLIAGSIDEAKLDASVNASLDLADSSIQPGDDAADLGSGAASDGHVLTADGAGGAAWEAVPVVGSMDDWILDADTGTPETVADGNTVTIAGGTGVDTAVSATDTVTVALDAATQASLALADTALQSGDNVSELTNDAGYITATLTEEEVEDFVGGMLTGNTETLITVTYQDTDGTIDFVVEDDLSLYDNTTSGFLSDITGEDLDDLADVVITTVADNEVLAYDNGSGNWINQTAAEAGLAASTHSHTESDITDLDHYTSTDFGTDLAASDTGDLAEGTNLYFTDERAQDAVGTILTDSSEIDFTYSDATPSITAALVASSIDESKLDASVNASLDLADSSVQPGDDAADLGSGAATDGFVLTADGAGGAAWEAVSGGGGGSMDDWVLDADSGTPETVADGNTVTIAGGTGIDTAVSATDTVTVNLDSGSIASLALADTSVQPGDDADTLGSGTATDGQVLTADGAGGAAWATPSGSTTLGGLTWLYEPGTGEPSSGYMRANNTTVSSISQFTFHETGSSGTDRAGSLTEWTVGTILTIQSASGSPSPPAQFKISSITDSGSYYTVGVSHLSGVPTWPNNADLRLHVLQDRTNTDPLQLGDGSASVPTYSFASDPDTGIYGGVNHVSVSIAGSRTWLAGSGGTTTNSTGGWYLSNSGTNASTPPYTFSGDTDTGMYRETTNTLSFATGGTRRLRIDSSGHIRHGNGGVTSFLIRSDSNSNSTGNIPLYSFDGDSDSGIARLGTNQMGLIAGGNAIALAAGSGLHVGWSGTTTGSGLYIWDLFTDIGNHETLRANRGSGSGTTNVGYFSSWINDPDTGELRKDEILPVAESPAWKREYFKELRPIYFRRISTGEHELGFGLDNFKEIDDSLKYLTTKGDSWGYSPDEFALLAVTVDYVQHLEERLVRLENKIKEMEKQ